LGDGIFSVGARLGSGAADFTSVTATEYAPFADFDTIGRGIPVSITITAPVASVPESTTLVLLVCGLVALGFLGQRKVS
jgi:hypothetical protein